VGTLVASVIAQDGGTSSASGSAQATVTPPNPNTNLAPVARAGGPYRGVAGQAIAFDARGSSDPDGSIESFVWSFGGGATATGATPRYVYAAPGTYSAALTVQDNRGRSDTGQATVTIVANSDLDGDGLDAAAEQGFGTNPAKADTNDDGIPDGAAIALGLSATNPDMDGDGAMNAAEITGRTDPFNPDSDGDGVRDGLDCFPLDASRTNCPVPDSGDHVAPVIILVKPSGATPVS